MANENSHTPGPWEAFHGETCSVCDSEHGRIATMSNLKWQHGRTGRIADAEIKANARLIAAAPDMLYILRGIANSTAEKSTRDLARRAIEKATGAMS